MKTAIKSIGVFERWLVRLRDSGQVGKHLDQAVDTGLHDMILFNARGIAAMLRNNIPTLDHFPAVRSANSASGSPSTAVDPEWNTPLVIPAIKAVTIPASIGTINKALGAFVVRLVISPCKPAVISRPRKEISNRLNEILQSGFVGFRLSKLILGRATRQKIRITARISRSR